MMRLKVTRGAAPVGIPFAESMSSGTSALGEISVWRFFKPSDVFSLAA